MFRLGAGVVGLETGIALFGEATRWRELIVWQLGQRARISRFSVAASTRIRDWQSVHVDSNTGISATRLWGNEVNSMELNYRLIRQREDYEFELQSLLHCPENETQGHGGAGTQRR